MSSGSLQIAPRINCPRQFFSSNDPYVLTCRGKEWNAAARIMHAHIRSGMEAGAMINIAKIVACVARETATWLYSETEYQRETRLPFCRSCQFRLPRAFQQICLRNPWELLASIDFAVYDCEVYSTPVPRFFHRTIGGNINKGAK